MTTFLSALIKRYPSNRLQVTLFMTMGLHASCNTDDGVKAFNSNPEATITSPADGDTVETGTSILFRGSVSDPNHSNTDLVATWLGDAQELCEPMVPESDGTVLCETALTPTMTNITLEVKDPLGAASSDQISLNLTNPSPNAQITFPTSGQMIDADTIISMTGTASDTNHPTTDLQAAWYANSIELCSATAPQADGTFSCETTFTTGTHEIQLTVTDPEGASGTDSLTITVEGNQPPVAEIISPDGSQQYYADQKITFTASVTDAEDSANDLQALWESDIDGPLTLDTTLDSTGLLTDAGYLSQGEHFITLTAIDSNNQSSSDQVTITVGEANSPPTCSITSPANNTTGAAGTVVSFSAEVNDVDIPASNLTITWESDKDGTLGTSTANSSGEVLFPYADLSTNSHVIALIVKDELGAECVDNIIYQVSTPPVLVITSPSNAATYNQGDLLAFSATVSDNEDAANQLLLQWESNLDGVISTQGATSAGIAQFTDSGLSYGAHSVTVTATDTHGMTASDVVTFTINGLPSQPTVSLSPTPANTGHDLVATASGSVDPEGVAVTYQYEWQKNGILTNQSTSTVPAGQTAKGETWTVIATPSDGQALGPSAQASVVIQNTPPSISGLQISPTIAYTNETLTCSATIIDPDETPNNTYEWYNAATGNLLASGPSLQLNSNDFAPGDEIQCRLVVEDSDGATATETATVTLQNQSPTIQSVTVTPTTPTNASLLTCAYSASDPDGENLTSSYQWVHQGTGIILGQNETLQLNNSLASPGDTLACIVTITDPNLASDSASDTVTITNTLPDTPSLILSPDPATTTDTLTAIVGPTSDADGDAVTLQYLWLQNGQVTSFVTSTLPSSATTKGQTWTVSVTPNDGIDDGIPATANITIANTPPESAVVTISPSAGITSISTVTCSATASDADNDLLSTTYQWTANGNIVATTASVSISQISTQPGDTLSCQAALSDGQASTSGSAAVTIENNLPVVSNISLTPSPAYTSDVLSANASLVDDDVNQTVEASYQWHTIDAISGIDNIVQDSSSSILNGNIYFQRDDIVYVVVTPFDGFGYGASVTSSTITIANSPPASVSIDLSPNPASAGQDDLNCSINVPSTDADGDPISYRFVWKDDAGTTQQTTTTSGLSDFFPASLTTEGTWTCEVTAFDGLAYSLTTSGDVVVEGGCVQHTDCVSGEFCGYWRSDGGYHCSAICSTDNDCNSDEICAKLAGSANARFCEPIPNATQNNGSSCNSGSECASGICFSGLCASQCSTQNDCQSNESCLLTGNLTNGPILGTCSTNSSQYYDIGQSCPTTNGWAGSVCETGHCDIHQYDSYHAGAPAYCRPLCSKEDDCDRSGTYPEVCEVVIATTTPAANGIPIETGDLPSVDGVTACYEPWGPLANNPIGTVCLSNADCNTNKCLPVQAGSAQRFCTGLCQQDSDCASGMKCGMASLNLINEWMYYHSGYGTSFLQGNTSLVRLCTF